MSEQEEIKKNSTKPAAQSEKTGTSKTFDELLHGFEEIKKIQTNSDIFKKSGSKPSFEKIKKNIRNQNNPDR